jgi:pimeloyl-ACP methyl ester carboxylesterase
MAGRLFTTASCFPISTFSPIRNDSYYYDQRGRGRSNRDVRTGDVGIASEASDVEAVRPYLRLNSVVALGHSWSGAPTAMT